MEKVSRFSDLEVYKLCRQLAKEIFELTKTFPKEETYSLIDQIRRASRSVGAQIAEAWARENTKSISSANSPMPRANNSKPNTGSAQPWIALT